jgi:hypothetical protein
MAKNHKNLMKSSVLLIFAYSSYPTIGRNLDKMIQIGQRRNTVFPPFQTDTLPIFGPVISSYSRAQSIADGNLVDLSRVIEPCPFKYPVAITIAAWDATLAAGGNWMPDGAGETMELPGGQDVPGRAHDMFCNLLLAIKTNARNGLPADRIGFTTRIDKRGNGRTVPVELYAVCGPGDTPEPVITIMLTTED